MYHTIFFVIVGILLFDYFFDRILDYLNLKHQSVELPDQLIGIYDSEKYRKSQEYDKTKSKFSFITSSFSLVLIMLMLFLGGFSFLDDWVRSISEHPIIMALMFFGAITLVSNILNIPFEIFSTFVIEEKFGFNKTTPKIFIFDKIKSWLLGAIIGGGILALIVWFYMLTTDYFWLYTWGFITVFMLFMSMFYSNLIVPLFNKQTPLQEGDLRNAIEDFSKKEGFKLNNIFVIDGSKRSTKANAYFTGLGTKKRIVLYDTLINDLEIPELVAVLAHEIGHNKKKHVTKGLITSIIQTGFMLFILSLFIDSPQMSVALGVKNTSFHIGIIAFGILYSPISTLLGIGTNLVSRKNEYQADYFAGIKYSGKHLGNALKKLSVKNLSNLTPHPVYVFFHYSHPTLLQRLKKLDNMNNS
ncbi:M48 family metallopeptidase [Bacteroidota bacterium]